LLEFLVRGLGLPHARHADDEVRRVVRLESNGDAGGAVRNPGLGQDLLHQLGVAVQRERAISLGRAGGSTTRHFFFSFEVYIAVYKSGY